MEAVYGHTKDGVFGAKMGRFTYAMVPVDDGGYEIKERFTLDPIETLESGSFYGHEGEIATVDEFRNFISDLEHHFTQREALGRRSTAKRVSTPWGQSDTETEYGPGLVFRETPSHGGFKVFAALNKQIPEPYRKDDGWYEEDCEGAKVVVSLPMYFTDKEVRDAERSVINSFPDEYEAVTGRTLAEGESIKKDERLFKERHANDWVVISVNTKTDGNGDSYCLGTATLGGLRSGWDTKEEIEKKVFRIPWAEYQKRSVHGFVVDLERHPEIEPEEPARGMTP